MGIRLRSRCIAAPPSSSPRIPHRWLTDDATLSLSDWEAGPCRVRSLVFWLYIDPVLDSRLRRTHRSPPPLRHRHSRVSWFLFCSTLAHRNRKPFLPFSKAEAAAPLIVIIIPLLVSASHSGSIVDYLRNLSIHRLPPLAYSRIHRLSPSLFSPILLSPHLISTVSILPDCSDLTP